MKTKANQSYRFVKLAILIFQPIILLQLLLNYDVIVINRFFKPLTPEYMTWYFDTYTPVANETSILGVSYVLNILFLLIFLLGILIVLSKPDRRKIIGQKRILISIGMALLSYVIIYFLIRCVAGYYRLYMDFVLTDIPCILAWYFISKATS